MNQKGTKGPPVTSEQKIASFNLKLHQKVASEFALSLFGKSPQQHNCIVVFFEAARAAARPPFQDESRLG